MERNSSDKICVIVVPIYKNHINRYEQISLSQCLKILPNYDIRFVAPKGVDLSFYDEKVRANAIFELEFFDGISGYNVSVKISYAQTSTNKKQPIGCVIV